MSDRSIYSLLKSQQEMMAVVLEKSGLMTSEQAKTIVNGEPVIKNIPGNTDNLSYTKHHVDSLFNVAELPYNEDAFFFDCNLERPICNLTIQPMASFLLTLPVRPTIALEKKYGFLTEWDTSQTGQLPVQPCDEPQSIDIDSNFCKMAFPLGRHDKKTQTMELDRLIATACQNAFDDFFFVGTVRGVSLFPRRPFRPNSRQDRDLITRGAVTKQIQAMTREHQKWLIQMLWSGDPTNNTAGGGYREPIGLLHMINNDIPNDPLLSQYLESQSGDIADCAAMNSDCKDFFNCIGDPTNDPTLFALMEELEQVIWERAFMGGVLPARWVWLMSPIHWNQLTKYLPCQMMADGCTNVGESIATPQINIDTFNLQLRQEMRSTNTITLNGRTYPVIMDHSIPYNQTDNEYQADIFFIPLELGGEPVLWIEHMDYRRIAPMLRALPNTVASMLGWTDGGRFHMTIDFLHRCFQILSKIEPRIVFKGSRFAGCIRGVRCCTIQPRENYWDPQSDVITQPPP